MEFQVRFRMHEESAEFQVASEKLGFAWHIFFRGNNEFETSGEVPLGGPEEIDRGIRGFLGGSDEGHGHNFVVRADIFTVVTVFLFVILPEGFPECGADQLEAFLTYAVEDAGRPRFRARPKDSAVLRNVKAGEHEDSAEQTSSADAAPTVQGTWLANQARWSRTGEAAIGVWVSSIANDRWGSPDELGPANLLSGSNFWRAEWKNIRDQWFIIDLGTATSLTAVRVKGDIKQPKKSPKDMKWQHSTSIKGDWKDAAIFTGSADGGLIEVPICPPVKSRWWRLYVHDTYGDGGRNQDMLIVKGFGIQVQAEPKVQPAKQPVKTPAKQKTIINRDTPYPRPFSLEQEWANRDSKRAPLHTLDTLFSNLAAEALESGGHCDASMLDGGVLCVSLPRCSERREHTCKELFEWGFPEPYFCRAYGPNDYEVLEWFNSERVHKFPPCFRCGDPGTYRCDCDNNVLLLEQVANWLSFRKAWQRISESAHEWTLLIEDDVKFTHRASECWNALITPQLLKECAGKPCMIRCGWQLGYAYMDDAPPELAENVVRMSNHCSILNRSMAKALLEGSDHLIDTTSDLYAHERLATQHRNYTMFPPISYDLSYARKVPSLIRPKGHKEDDLMKSEEVHNAQRVDVRQIRRWLRCLTWAPFDTQDEAFDDYMADFDGIEERSSSSSRDSFIYELRNFGEPLSYWSDLLTQETSAKETIRLEGRYVMLDPEPPPQWIYSARCLYVGDGRRCPRGYLPVSL